MGSILRSNVRLNTYIVKMVKRLSEVIIPDFTTSHVENVKDKTVRMFKKTPSLLLGLSGGLGGLAYMAKKFSQKGNMKPSVYFIHTRLLAQITVVGSLTGAMVYGLYQQSSQYWRDSSRAFLMKAKQEKHRIIWPKGGYESKPGPGIVYTQFRKTLSTKENLEEAMENNVV